MKDNPNKAVEEKLDDLIDIMEKIYEQIRDTRRAIQEINNREKDKENEPKKKRWGLF